MRDGRRPVEGERGERSTLCVTSFRLKFHINMIHVCLFRCEIYSDSVPLVHAACIPVNHYSFCENFIHTIQIQ